MIPRSTYRLQLNAQFTFRDATRLVAYLADLGISHVYCSPYFRARPGSMHGYDIVDHNAFNPEIGTREDFEEFVATLREHGMGHIADFVPNHVGIGNDNAWWMDVLENGVESQYAQFFDIDWAATGKVLIPVLGDTYGAVLEGGELQLRAEPASATYAVFYHEHRFPIARKDYATAGALLAVGQPDADALHELLEVQAYRLAYWRVASDEINYRRFFDVNDLAALRMENEAVFDATHRLVLELIRSGKLDGLRIDHPDGLYDPAGYFRRLQRSADSQMGSPLYLVVEKITASFERLPDSWAVHGTTGYHFANVVNGLFVDGRAKRRMQRAYENFTGESTPWPEVAYESKQILLDTSLAAELNVLTQQLARIARADRHTRDFTVNNLRRVLSAIIACFPVYRTYVADTASEEDRRFIDWAIALAKRRDSGTDTLIFDFVRGILLDETPAATQELRRQIHVFAMKFQQVTSPVTAKGVEDTAMYRFNRLASLNEVGGEPDRFGVSVSAFHADARYRARHWPQEMLATSTHDTKRSEDVRARINVLSEMPAVWRRLLMRWSRINRTRKSDIGGRPAPGPNQEYLLYQTLLGTWPLEPMDDAARNNYCERIEAYVLKAAREAKMRTSWSDASTDYEQALRQFVRAILEPRESNPFINELIAAQNSIARFGLLNSLSQTLCKLTAPGVPDIYQGNEIWDFSLVDPDNRRPVDYGRRRNMLRDMQQAETSAQYARSLLNGLEDGRAKLYVTWKALQFRRAHEAVFRDGEHIPARVVGIHAQHVCAYLRRVRAGPSKFDAPGGPDFALIIVPRLYARLLGEDPAAPLGEQVWADTAVELPGGLPMSPLTNVMDGLPVPVHTRHGCATVMVHDALSHFPVALLSGYAS